MKYVIHRGPQAPVHTYTCFANVCRSNARQMRVCQRNCCCDVCIFTKQTLDCCVKASKGPVHMCTFPIFPLGLLSKFTINLLAFYHKCCNLIGYATNSRSGPPPFSYNPARRGKNPPDRRLLRYSLFMEYL